MTDVDQATWFEREQLLLPAFHPSFGEYWRTPAKIDFDGFAPNLGPASGIGEHTQAILSEIGYSEKDYRELADAGVVGEYKEPVPRS